MRRQQQHVCNVNVYKTFFPLRHISSFYVTFACFAFIFCGRYFVMFRYAIFCQRQNLFLTRWLNVYASVCDVCIRAMIFHSNQFNILKVSILLIRKKPQQHTTNSFFAFVSLPLYLQSHVFFSANTLPCCCLWWIFFATFCCAFFSFLCLCAQTLPFCLLLFFCSFHL